MEIQINRELQSFFEGAPSAEEIDYHIGNDPEFWSNATPREAIDEIKYIRDTYYEVGHNNYDMLNEGESKARQEIKDIKALIRYLENKLAYGN